MLYSLGLIAFLVYTSLIFFIKEYYMLLAVLAINAILMLILKINIKKGIIFIMKLLPFIIFTSAINVILGNIELGILIGLRLILVCNITYIYSKKQTTRNLQIAIEKILIPFKIVGVNPREISIIVSISIAFIPIMQKEIENLKYSLLSKGFKMNLKNFVTKPSYILMSLITSVIKKTAEIEQSMISKGYISL